MSTIGSLVFCTVCGNLLPLSNDINQKILECGGCGTKHKDTGARKITSKSKPSDYPSLLRQKLQSGVQAVDKHNIQTSTVIQETCPKCGREEVRYTNLQLRSADEGSTVFFMCDCGHSWQQDN